MGGVDGAMLAGYCERPLWTGLPFPGAATTPTNAKIAGGVDGEMQAGCCERPPPIVLLHDSHRHIALGTVEFPFLGNCRHEDIPFIMDDI